MIIQYLIRGVSISGKSLTKIAGRGLVTLESERVRELNVPGLGEAARR